MRIREYSCGILFGILFIFASILMTLVPLSRGYCTEVRSLHPRLVKLNFTNGSAINELKKKADYYLSCADNDIVGKKYREAEFIRSYSFLYGQTKNKRYLDKARRLSAKLVTLGMPIDDQQVRSRLQALAYYYDICFSVLNNYEKNEVGDAIWRNIEWLERKGYLKGDNFGGGHHHYAHISAIIGCIAIYSEKEEARILLPLLEKHMKDGFQSFYRFLADKDGGFHMWWEYSRYYIFNELEFCDVWMNATGEDLFRANTWLEKTSLYLIAGLRDNLTFWATGDNGARGFGWIDMVIFEKIATEFNNSYAKAIAHRLNAARKSPPDIDELYFRALWEDDSLMGKPLDQLLDVLVFNKVGVYVFNEKGINDGVSALFKCSPIYFFNHSHRDANSFEIWYKDDLAIDSGYYDAYRSSHWWNYYVRSIAHNTVLIKDPNEQFCVWGACYANDGGQRFITKPYELPFNCEDLNSPFFHVSDSTLLDDNDNFSIVVGDATKAYSSTKCDLFRRYFIWLKKVKGWEHPVIIVYDQVVSTMPEFEKVWLLHSINKPEVNDGLITIINGDGKLRCKIVQPEAFKIDVVGGAHHEFDVDGINYPPDFIYKKNIEKWAGAWRIELRDSAPLRKKVSFLAVLVPSEVLSNTMPPIISSESGVIVSNWQISVSDEGVNVMRVES